MLPPTLDVTLIKAADLRYGENPHQAAAVYLTPDDGQASVARAVQHGGKPLSYINLLDADAALAAVKDFGQPAACVVKHATPCGLAAADDLATAVTDALAGDPLAAFGGIVAVNKPMSLHDAEALAAFDKLLEVVVAPGYGDGAVERLKKRWKNCRLLEVSGRMTPDPEALALHRIAGGVLVQQPDAAGLPEMICVTKRQPTDAERAALAFAWRAVKHVKSNAVILASGTRLVGVGGGQVDRVAAAEQAVAKAGDRAAGSVAAGDAFFPFPDGPALLLDAGAAAIIQPGGSVRDRETIDLCDARGAAMLFTGMRHFRH